MFYQGSLQEGISTAVGQQKLVLCFVTNKDEESQQWEDDFLRDSSLSGLIQGQAVALRLEAGSDEAGYLGQIFPLPQTPTVVIMKHGELKEYISSGTGKEEFIRRVQSAFNVSSAAAPHTSDPPPPAPQAETPALSSSPQTDRSESVRRVLAERAAKLQAQKDEAERRAKEDQAKAREKAKAEAAASADTDAARTHQQAELLKKKRQQETEERKRILKRIEDDREERRQRAAERERKRIDSQTTGDIASSLVNAPQSKLPSTTRVGAMASIQVRLFDGSTMRSRFKTGAPFKDVREWVDETRTDGKMPYTFRQLLTPMPNKAIDETEEGKSMGELGLAPSSTLILIPVQNFTSAYEGGSQGVLPRLIAAILSFLTWLTGLVGLGGNRETAQQPVAAGSERSSGSAQEKDRRIRGFQNPNDQRRDQQLYNGNSLNFEPRPDEDEK